MAEKEKKELQAREKAEVSAAAEQTRPGTAPYRRDTARCGVVPIVFILLDTNTVRFIQEQPLFEAEFLMGQPSRLH